MTRSLRFSPLILLIIITIFIYNFLIVAAMASHAHSHHHRDGHASGAGGEGNTFTDLNRKHWDKTASTYSSEQWQKDFLNRTHEFILSNLEWIGVDFLDPSVAFEGGGEEGKARIRVLDYACGPGTITSILHGYATEFIGVDLSEKMVETYNERFGLAGLQQQERQDQEKSVRKESSVTTLTAKAHVGDLLHSSGPSASVAGPEFFNFDLAVVGYGFHHFENLEVATTRLSSRLKPGGVLMIVDFVTHAKLEGVNANHQAIIAHNGFGEDEVKEIFGRAGLVEVGVVEMETDIELRMPGGGEGGNTVRRKIFLGKGRKPL